MRRVVWAVVLLCVAAGCKRKAETSEHWEKGHALYQQLYVRELDDAFLDPRMADAEGELQKVPQASVDYASAQELLQTISKGRAEAQRLKDEREKSLAAASPAAAPLPPSLVAARAPPPPGDPLSPGASLADVNKGGCLTAAEPFREQQTGMSGTVYRLADSETCRKELPGLADQVLLVVDGKIYRRLAASDVRAAAARATADAGAPDAGAADAGAADAGAADAGAPRDAGAPPVRQPAAPAPASDAGTEPEPRLYVPGQPQPEAEQPSDGG